MKYLFTVLAIALGWIVAIAVMPLLSSDDHLPLYLLALLNSVVLYWIGFKSS